mmetsp:Transcript_13091/g.29858  ORF Transcript_13091/g.29858 Transcript_13091/m.29858 type:complete len:209 (+) Transcript_13091:48-674(+)
MGHIQQPVQQPRRVRPRHAIGAPAAPPPRGLAVQQVHHLPIECRDVFERPVLPDAEPGFEVCSRKHGVLVHALRRERVDDRRGLVHYWGVVERLVVGNDQHPIDSDAFQIGRYDPVVALPHRTREVFFGSEIHKVVDVEESRTNHHAHEALDDVHPLVGLGVETACVEVQVGMHVELRIGVSDLAEAIAQPSPGKGHGRIGVAICSFR